MRSSTRPTPVIRSLMAVTAITAWVALGLQLYILLGNTPGNGMTPVQAVGRFFLFFTVLCNLLVAISYSIILLKPYSKAAIFFTRPPVIAAITLYIFIVGLVYNLVLRSQWKPTGSQKIADELLHVFVPLLATIYWIFFASKTKLPWKTIFPWLGFPAVYLVYAMVRGAMEGHYAYFFLDLEKYGAGKVALNCTLVLVAFVVIGLLLIAYSRSVKKKY